MRSTVIANTDDVLLAAGEYTSTALGLGPATQYNPVEGDFAALLGYAKSDVAGTVYIWEGSTYADVSGVAAGNGTLVTSYAVSAGGNGTKIAQALSAPFVRVVYVNGGSNQASFRLIVRAVE